METLEKIKVDFEKFAIEQSCAFAEGEGKKTNRFHKKIQLLHKQAKELDCINVFESFLDNKNENVMLWASIFCLEISPKLAWKNLVNLSHSSEPIISLSAKATLDSLRKGRLILLCWKNVHPAKIYNLTELDIRILNLLIFVQSDMLSDCFEYSDF